MAGQPWQMTSTPSSLLEPPASAARPWPVIAAPGSVLSHTLGMGPSRCTTGPCTVTDASCSSRLLRRGATNVCCLACPSTTLKSYPCHGLSTVDLALAPCSPAWPMTCSPCPARNLCCSPTFNPAPPSTTKLLPRHEHHGPTALLAMKRCAFSLPRGHPMTLGRLNSLRGR